MGFSGFLSPFPPVAVPVLVGGHTAPAGIVVFHNGLRALTDRNGVASFFNFDSSKPVRILEEGFFAPGPKNSGIFFKPVTKRTIGDHSRFPWESSTSPVELALSNAAPFYFRTRTDGSFEGKPQTAEWFAFQVANGDLAGKIAVINAESVVLVAAPACASYDLVAMTSNPDPIKRSLATAALNLGAFKSVFEPYDRFAIWVINQRCKNVATVSSDPLDAYIDKFNHAD